ncbi:CBS domain-containing protein [Pseudonocardia sp. N23]|uniref:CBS domain-containing protein n=1 Tax=Pseudonocardia sp. N23 TaxID=1987376 RepID=UPI000BFDA288|nr:CBS domain-containing protein [Pseudonocardia sp. N23]GAY11448.1 CBS domain protein [Pseudonocardia sp. N23]
MVLRAREIMSHRVVTVRADAPVSLAEKRLAEFRFSALPVVDDRNRLVGMVSVVDLLRHREEQPGGSQAPVESVMTRDIIHMSPNAGVGIIAHRMRTYGELRVVPIVDRGVLVGVVTRSDLIRPRPTGGPVSRAVRRFVERRSEDLRAEPSYRPPPRRPRSHPADATVRDAMTSTDLVSITEEQTTEDAAALLTGRRLTSVPVVRAGDRLVGVISEADLLRDPLDGRRTGRARTVGGAMSRDPVTVGPDDPLSVARRLMSDRGFRILPVVQAGRLVGVVSRRDLL